MPTSRSLKMSLFGTSPPDGAHSPSVSTMFDDGAAAGTQKKSGLFTDDMDESSDSPWTIGLPKKQARSIPATDVPESYITHTKQQNQGSHTNGVSSGVRSSVAYNVPSSSITAAANTSSTSTSGPPGARLSSGAENSWGVYNAASEVNYGSSDSGADEFRRSAGDEGNNQPPPGKARPSGVGRSHGRGAEEIVRVIALPEKEGIFLFQYRNYEVASSRRNSKVIRRYSDFVWLLDCLHKKYPFRQLPLLPPKKVASMSLRYLPSYCSRADNLSS